jgi:hypothetical protein
MKVVYPIVSASGLRNQTKLFPTLMGVGWKLGCDDATRSRSYLQFDSYFRSVFFFSRLNAEVLEISMGCFSELLMTLRKFMGID